SDATDGQSWCRTRDGPHTSDTTEGQSWCRTRDGPHTADATEGQRRCRTRDVIQAFGHQADDVAPS
ncbi:MAG: hypothetical protein M1379_06690, partial [Firmicutes bacterium]|nr:hypothetical protein [Bacillota bacterium]